MLDSLRVAVTRTVASGARVFAICLAILSVAALAGCTSPPATQAESDPASESAMQYVVEAYEADWGEPFEGVRAVDRDTWLSFWTELESEETHPFIRGSDWIELPSESVAGRGPFYFSGQVGDAPMMLAVWRETTDREWQYRGRP